MTTPHDPAALQVPVCPRHPDRASYIRCQRCERPACPECQHQAAVGVHCVDCVREAKRNAPQARTAFGAPLRGGRPVVTLTFIGLCLVSFVLQQAMGWEWTGLLAFSPAAGEVEPYRFLTTAFLHAPGFLHIAVNMYALWVVGPSLEFALGRWRFVSLYLLSALGGSVMVTLLATPGSQAWFTAVVGASGAVFGLFGAILIVLRRLGQGATQILVIIAINAVIGFMFPRISWEAHLGGLVVGLLLGLAFAYAPRDRRGPVGVAAAVGVGVALLLLTLGRYVLAG